ncbi:ABC-three component system protein [Paenibacillus sepulcri]|uniref:ABC-three component systems C-terminal domain-containing protein n=1 Tax=Paenibacillus sepulcri TaxID=359917 RepID=A0ABS7C1W0_9BACL|nr:hypothetical protein [Paenibacillus sepulcri]
MSLNIELFCRNANKQGRVLVLLIHGLGAPDTWVMPGCDWRNQLLADPGLEEADVGIVKYETAHLISGLFGISGTYSIMGRNITVRKNNVIAVGDLAQHLKTKLSTGRFKSYQKIVIAGHSMGGLVGMRYILNEFENHKNVNRIGGYISYATPFNGSSMADFHKLIKPVHKHNQIVQLEPNCGFLDDMIRAYSEHQDPLRQQMMFNYCFGDKDPFVVKESAVPHTGRAHTYNEMRTLPGDHGTVLDLSAGILSTNYELLKDLILDVSSTVDPRQFYVSDLTVRAVSPDSHAAAAPVPPDKSRQLIRQFEQCGQTLRVQFIERFSRDAQDQLLHSMDQVLQKLKGMNEAGLEKFMTHYRYSTQNRKTEGSGLQELWELLTLINVVYPNWNFIAPDDLFQLPNLRIDDHYWVRLLYSVHKETMPEIIIGFLSKLYNGAFRQFLMHPGQSDIFPHRFILENVNAESMIPQNEENICEHCKGRKANFSKILVQFGRTENLSVFQGLEPNYLAKEVSISCASCIRQARNETSFTEICERLRKVI